MTHRVDFAPLEPLQLLAPLRAFT